MKLIDIERNARIELRTRFGEMNESDLIHEIADSFVPISNYNIIGLAAETPHLALDVPDHGPAFNGKPTPINIIAGNIYEYLSQVLCEELNLIKQEQNTTTETEEDEDV